MKKTLGLLLAVVLTGVIQMLDVSGVQAQPEVLSDAPEKREVKENSVTSYGSAAAHGPHESLIVAEPLVGMAAKADGNGYWLVASDGGVFTFGDAHFFGSTGAMVLNQPVVGMAATPSGNGYWLVASDGGVFTFGDAQFYGSTGAMVLNQPVVGMAATSSGNGYWLVASDGGIFTFGDAQFYGSTGAMVLNEPVVGMAATPSRNGYWLVASDGGVFTFGDAPFRGSAANEEFADGVVDMAADPNGNGYWLVSKAGDVYAFGVADHGSASRRDLLTTPATLAMAAAPSGGYWLMHGAVPVVNAQDAGPHVEQLQRQLQSDGYWVGVIDGVYGELTRQAVYAFQKVHNLPVTGVADPDMLRLLIESDRPRPAVTSGDHIEVDKTRQVVFVVRGGTVLWTFNTSTGTEEYYTYEGQRLLADTPTGDWNVYRAVDGVDVGALGRLYRPRYFHTDGIALHGYSIVPPRPASHGCVRLTNAAIDFVWAENLAPIGARVLVYGSSPPPA